MEKHVERLEHERQMGSLSQEAGHPVPAESEGERTPATRTGDRERGGPVASDRLAGIWLGRILALSETNAAIVEVEGSEPAVQLSRAVWSLKLNHVGRRVALMYEQGDPGRPLLVGLVEEAKPATTTPAVDTPPKPLHLTIDGGVLTLTADRELILRCGRASILLRSDGRIAVRGAHISSRSTGANLIRGATVELN